MMYIPRFTLAIIGATLTVALSAAQNFPLKIERDKLEYIVDERGDRIVDFSYCGYQASQSDIPNLPSVIMVAARSGDMSAELQSAIDKVSSLKPNKNGFRGAVLLGRGQFNIERSLDIRSSGVVLRGSGVGQTVILKTGAGREAAIRIEGENDRRVQTKHRVLSEYLPVNSHKIRVSEPNTISKGDRVQVFRPSSAEWIASIGCTEFGGGISALGWKPSDIDMRWDRVVADVKGDTILLDAPLTMALDVSQGQCEVWRYRFQGRIDNCGVENLTMLSEYDKKYPKDENHAWSAISIDNAENCWVRKVDFRHFAASAVALLGNSQRITVEDCRSSSPISEIAGLRRVTYLTMGQQNLFQRCYAEDGIHDFAAGALAAGPNAFVQCASLRANGFSGSIGSWACGLLYDVVDIDGNNIALKNLGQHKNGAGWNSANSMIWQCTASEIECFSPDVNAKNRAYGCWAQFSGDGDWDNSNNHVRPRSLFYAQLSERLGRDMSYRAKLMPLDGEATSSPTVEQAAEMVKRAREPRMTLDKWIAAIPFVASCDAPLEVWKFTAPMATKAAPAVLVVDGRIVCGSRLLVGARREVPWWNGSLKESFLPKAKAHLTRFVPSREGRGLTDRIDTVIVDMVRNNVIAIDHNYGLWYDRRRDDHQRVRRATSDVWGPLYEQPFGRSSEGVAWDGLSKYDLDRPNEWYWMRLKEYAQKAGLQGKLLFNQQYFQHNIIEAGAHWADSPWRSANNINSLGFPEPVPYAGDKRIFMAEYFYDIQNPRLREYHSKYIRRSLDAFADNTNVIHFISAEFTGPLHFVQFWIDEIALWQRQTGKDALVALSATKDVQDAILADTLRSKIVDIIDIRYWHYKSDGTTYEPKGGLSLAPRQQARKTPVGKVGFNQAYRAVREYRSKYPQKAVIYYAQNYPEMAPAVLMASGSLPQVSISDVVLTADIAKMQPIDGDNTEFCMMGRDDVGFVLYFHKQGAYKVTLPKGKYSVKYVDLVTGVATKASVVNVKESTCHIDAPQSKSSICWFKRIK